MKPLLLAAALLLLPPSALWAEVVPPPGMDIYVLGEVHDNPAHHAEQARLVALIKPGAVVWEMLTTDQAKEVPGRDISDAAGLEAALGWEAAGWPDFGMYHPIFLAAGGARHLGAAVPRADLRPVIEKGLAGVLDAATLKAWGLGPLAAADQAAREAEQAGAHCNALPAELLPGMVDAQRLRDWSLARAAVEAVEAGQGPVVVITGTGHARRDTGMPALVAAARPGIKLWALGQVEGAAGPDEPFDAVNVADPVPREDPCLAFSGG